MYEFEKGERYKAPASIRETEEIKTLIEFLDLADKATKVREEL